MQQCPFCNGSGFQKLDLFPEHEVYCIHCNGSGEVEKDYLIPDEYETE